MTQLVYRYHREGGSKMKPLLGGKGANLAEMCNVLKLPVPAGFTITTEVCNAFYANNRRFPDGLERQVYDALADTEQVMGKKFGDPKNPLLVSCRSGARESMPGMMDTVLNIGLNETTLQGIIAATDNPRFGWDCYRRFIQMYGDVVLDMKPQDKREIDPFEAILETVRHEQGVKLDNELSVSALQDLTVRFKRAVKDQTGHDFPEDPYDQLWRAIGAVFGSWMNDRAIVYRRKYGIPSDWGTAANICAMVFGNMGNDCATGVAMTRDVALGTPGLNGDYLINAQGEDVVAGIRTPLKIEETLRRDMPECYDQLEGIALKLERHYKDVQDIEFTIERGKVWMLQTRNAKRTGFAHVRTAVEMVAEGLTTKEAALMRIPAGDLDQLLKTIFDPASKRAAEKAGRLLAKGINAGPGAATGRIKFFADEAVDSVRQEGPGVILVRRETSPEDLRGMEAADGILTAFGGASSHAALVSRQMGKVCIVGCKDLVIDYHARTVTVSGRMLHDGDYISIDGFTGEVFEGQIDRKPSEIMQVLVTKTLPPEKSEAYQQFKELMSWADDIRRLRIRTNADQPDQALQAIAFGAEGIGLCRIEHMFFNHIDEMRELILAESLQDRKTALGKLLPFLYADFKGLFLAMNGLPMTVRLMDPPMHEFLPHEEAEQKKLAELLDIPVQRIQSRVEALHEFNPMLGFRGCRLGIVYPDITAMQVRAILAAACDVKQEGIDVHPEIMIPLVAFRKEFDVQALIVHDVAKAVFEEKGMSVEYSVGTMIELPRACVSADKLTGDGGAEFFSFGTNDLTQTGLGMSRDDYGSFITHYREMDIVPSDPFQSIDEGIGLLMEIGVQKGRKVNPNLKIGICGEHGGDPDSVKLCHRLGLNYVSCSPSRIPGARLAAAQAFLEYSIVLIRETAARG